MYNPFSLEGKTILVTGASSGIGKATAIECSKLGASIVLTGRNEERLKETKNALNGYKHMSIAVDLTNSEDIIRLLSNTPLLDGVVFSVGRGFTLPIQFATREKFDELFNINFFAPIELFRLLVKKKKMKQNSSAVFIVSIGGTSNFSIGNSVYGSSKAALQSIVKYCALEYAPKSIRVNGINPGMVKTPLIYDGTLTKEQLEIDEDNYPLKRYGKPEDIAKGSVYLLSDASSWMTGQFLIIDGGITLK